MPEMESSFTGSQLRVIAEIQRIADKLNVDRLSSNDFDLHHELSGLSTAGYQFGSWNRAVVAAGLHPNEPGYSNKGPKLSDEELLTEIIRVHRQLGKKPSEREISHFGNYSVRPYKARWGTFSAAREVAYERYGIPPD